MPYRKVARFHAHRHESAGASSWKQAAATAILRIMDLATVVVLILLVAAPFLWRTRQANKYMEAWSQHRLDQAGLLESDYMTLPPLPAVTLGSEPAVQAFLKDQPLVEGMQERFGSHQLWMRQGDVLVKAGPTPEAALVRQWFAKAAQSQSFITNPTEALPGEARSGPKIVLMGNQWLVVKCWQEGSPAVERFLRKVLTPNSRARLLLMKDGDEDKRNQKNLQPQAWGAEPNLQADLYRFRKPIFTCQLISNEIPGWNLTMIPFLADAYAFRRQLALQFALAAACSMAVGGSMLLTRYLRYRSRRKAALDADRMASMTHSLKTPLAILKFRCDSLRLGRLAPDQLDAQLIQVGEEADRLSGIIENALMVIQGPAQAGPQDEVTPEWLAEIGEDLAPAFEAAGRHLVLACQGNHGKASLPSLRAALFTLLENALYHGGGTVTLETIPARKRLLLRVTDEGPGLDAQALKSLGRPFMRIRDQDKEGFSQDGIGLGLSLLTKVVEREGWGLAFASEPGKGLIATLEIHIL